MLGGMLERLTLDQKVACLAHVELKPLSKSGFFKKIIKVSHWERMVDASFHLQ
jgi:hypothetical protein